ncbi:hypothetical protein PVA17_22885 [Lysinibacillus sp. CNPSo 3705]|uniref:hypothetical protein n=1 Tax=Lysinibacillus sp. CNPSo 3705 TaxID=3028148 RepID=UPI0023639221|nr:hypothetical protein [Lysinibacillus sp. CNPSo 3705]MDD1505569.1 hypothetical protein [Lysinibacillus sp. CNPSo 3705]
MLLEPIFQKRLVNMVVFSWEIFSRKVGSGLIKVNKEASMQLKYAYILQEMIPLTIFDEREKIEIELETTRSVNGKTREIDILIIGTDSTALTYTIAIELKCYKYLAASGNPRGAHDVFMKDVYYDLYLLEQYQQNNCADECISLVMTDYKTSVSPINKTAKCWDYDISQNAQIMASTNFTTAIGGKSQNFTLNKNYSFSWNRFGSYWFTSLQGY